MSEEKEPFLSRWSRRKTETREAPPAPAATPEAVPAVTSEPVPVAAPAGEAGAPAPLPRVEDLTPESDFKPFMDPRVDAPTRRAALKRLFADARFNVPDPFEAYSEDYTLGEPIPAEMLKTLNHARKLLFDETEQAAGAAAEPPQDASREIQDGAGKQDA